MFSTRRTNTQPLSLVEGWNPVESLVARERFSSTYTHWKQIYTSKLQLINILSFVLKHNTIVLRAIKIAQLGSSRLFCKTKLQWSPAKIWTDTSDASDISTTRHAPLLVFVSCSFWSKQAIKWCITDDDISMKIIHRSS